MLLAPALFPWLRGSDMAAQKAAQTTDILQLPPPRADARIAYGTDPSQFGDLRLPAGPGPHAVVIVIHGGFWKAAYSLDHIGTLCAALTRAGVATWSLEYRRIGNPGGGWTGTFEDVAKGADYLHSVAPKHRLDTTRVAAIGHSAGGHLALWLAARRRIPMGSPIYSADPLRLRGAVALAGVVDLKRAWQLKLSSNIVTALLGGSPDEFPDRYRAASPIELLPIGSTQRLIHGTKDEVVPFEISEDYVKAAVAVGDDAKLIALPGAGHFEVIDPRSAEWPQIQHTITSLVLSA